MKKAIHRIEPVTCGLQTGVGLACSSTLWQSARADSLEQLEAATASTASFLCL